MPSAVSEAISQSLLSTINDPVEFISRLQIVDQSGVEHQFNKPYAEQVVSMEDFLRGHKMIVHCKPRQIGDSTVGNAWNFSYGYRCLDPIRTLIMANDADATDSLFRCLKHFHDSLPTILKRPLKRSNRKEMEFADTGVIWRCLTAGGRGQGRAWTHQRLHADEVAFWPNDESVWASVTSTLHEGPHKQIFVTSTPNGPGGLYHRLVMQAMADPETCFRFFRWADHAAYRMKPPADWEPTQEEADLASLHGLDILQLYWRHQKIWGGQGIGQAQFRREYPLTVEEGFLEFAGSWFDVGYLNEVLSTLRPWSDSEAELRVHEQPETGMTYAIGADPSWGTGGDWAVAQVVSHDARHVACFRTRSRTPEDFAFHVARLSMHYNKARVLPEGNPGGGGQVLVAKLREMGVPMWFDPQTGKVWKTTGGSKGRMYSHLRQMVDSDAMTLMDFETVQELMHIRDSEGSIEGQDGMHDDMADALALAVWNLRSLPDPVGPSVFPFKRRRKALPHPFGV